VIIDARDITLGIAADLSDRRLLEALGRENWSSSQQNPVFYVICAHRRGNRKRLT
jgi:hypothetical protein